MPIKTIRGIKRPRIHTVPLSRTLPFSFFSPSSFPSILFFHLFLPTTHSSPTSSNSSGQGSNGQNVGVSCPLSDVGRNPNMEQPKRRYMEKKMKKKEKKQNICTLLKQIQIDIKHKQNCIVTYTKIKPTTTTTTT